ncbi:hypothetical protein NOGI109294_26980 [Nocardiopsis gilva]|nr:hypothetical protein [Nocardiopsis gilva]
MSILTSRRSRRIRPYLTALEHQRVARGRLFWRFAAYLALVGAGVER